MRHRKSGRKLKRTASHRKATLAALATSLLRHKRITTTVAKAKETRMVVERLITKAKRALAPREGDAAAVAGSERQQQFVQRGAHARRLVSRLINDREVVKELFSEIVEKIGDRPGGYTRIVKLGQRAGDGAEMAVIELVDYNVGKESKEKPSTPAKEKKPKKTAPRKKVEKESDDQGTPGSGDKKTPFKKKKSAPKKRGSSPEHPPEEPR
jgi:large subunit ribosomal protein L17